ncbi:MAG: hypothetical protein V3S43_06145 [Acidimicrobiia bacterium]
MTFLYIFAIVVCLLVGYMVGHTVGYVRGALNERDKQDPLTPWRNHHTMKNHDQDRNVKVFVDDDDDLHIDRYP